MNKFQLSVLSIIRKGFSYKGSIPCSELDRLTQLPSINNIEKVDTDVTISSAVNNIIFLDGLTICNLNYVCRICNDIMNENITIKNAIAFNVSRKELMKVEANGYQIIDLENNTLNLCHVIEDDIILNINDYPKHEFDCS